MDDHVRIVARGMGHGFGLSQNTAEELAKEGYDYREILEYFYKGAVIGRLGIYRQEIKNNRINHPECGNTMVKNK